MTNKELIEYAKEFIKYEYSPQIFCIHCAQRNGFELMSHPAITKRDDIIRQLIEKLEQLEGKTCS